MTLAGLLACGGRGAAMVVAHPDDETIGLGGHLADLPHLVVVHVTDGSPSDLADARSHGLGTREAYASARREELSAALALAGVGPERQHRLDVPDQGATEAMAEVARALAHLLERENVGTVLTHPYEGGHPDHDAVCWAVHAASKLNESKGRPRLTLAEMAFYHAGPEGWIRQEFLPGPDGEAAALQGEGWDRKARMLARHATQAGTLASFTSHVERVRPAPAYDFGQPANGGLLLYERHGWGMTGERWLAAARQAGAALGLDLPCR